MISGKFLSCKLNTTLISGVHEWSCNEQGDKLEATTGADAGRGKKDVGVIDMTVRMVLYLDINAGSYTGLRVGTTLSALKLFADTAATTPLFSFTSAKVFACNVRGQVRDRFIVEVEAEPSGNVITAAEPN